MYAISRSEFLLLQVENDCITFFTILCSFFFQNSFVDKRQNTFDRQLAMVDMSKTRNIVCN